MLQESLLQQRIASKVVQSRVGHDLRNEFSYWVRQSATDFSQNLIPESYLLSISDAKFLMSEQKQMKS